MKLTFLSAQDLSDNQPITTYVFFYTLDDSTAQHSIHIVGSDNQQYNLQEGLHDYAQKLFSGALFVIETLWDQAKQLPDEQRHYYDKTDFPQAVMTAIPWEGYELVLIS